MGAVSLVPIVNEPRDYAWGLRDGISELFGWVRSGRPEAELWLGAHPASPSRAAVPAPWSDLAEWQNQAGRQLPFLLKVLAADSPLSLQAHPTAGQAREGFLREEACRVPLDSPSRNYKDPNAKPEMIVALKDGFRALCGFRSLEESVADIAALAEAAVDPAALRTWLSLLTGGDGLRRSVSWLLGGGQEVSRLVAQLPAAAEGLPPSARGLVELLTRRYPGDAGVAVALLLNQVELASGEALWLPAGNIHAYLSGVGVELMGPSDNVLRGGLTPKHVDVPELLRVLDFRAGPVPMLVPEHVAEHARAYVPPVWDPAAFVLHEVTGEAAVATGSASIVMGVDGCFRAHVAGEDAVLGPGDALFVSGPAALDLSGCGRAFIASSAAG
ncbi:mannose-6-phosphate isomerase, class I [Tessaracoccus sp. G1721]